jgi:hypothetical protein
MFGGTCHTLGACRTQDAAAPQHELEDTNPKEQGGNHGRATYGHVTYNMTPGVYIRKTRPEALVLWNVLIYPWGLFSEN